MPLQMPKRRLSEAERKITLLLCLSALESASADQLWPFVAEQELMDYFPMQLDLHELETAGEIERGASAMSDQLFLTDSGRKAIALFGGRVPAETRSRILAAAPAYRARLRQHNEVRIAYDIARKGEYRLRMLLSESELPTLCVVLSTTRRAIAEKAMHRFESCAPELLTFLYGLALEGASEPAPEGAVMEQSAEEWIARADLSAENARFAVELLLPSRERAEGFAAACANRSADVAVVLNEKLIGKA